jgi:hypothetical protein
MELNKEYLTVDRHIHRIRISEFALIEGHVHVEAVVVRNESSRHTVARGLRFLVRSRATPTKGDGDAQLSQEVDNTFPFSWFDPPIQDGSKLRSEQRFVDEDGIPELIEKLTALIATARRWEADHTFEQFPNAESILAIAPDLLIGVVWRERKHQLVVELRAERPIWAGATFDRLPRFKRWVDDVCDKLKAVNP